MEASLEAGLKTWRRVTCHSALIRRLFETLEPERELGNKECEVESRVVGHSKGLQNNFAPNTSKLPAPSPSHMLRTSWMWACQMEPDHSKDRCSLQDQWRHTTIYLTKTRLLTPVQNLSHAGNCPNVCGTEVRAELPYQSLMCPSPYLSSYSREDYHPINQNNNQIERAKLPWEPSSRRELRPGTRF